MKNFLKIMLISTILTCLALQFMGCKTYKNSENCGGIVKGYKCLGEKEKSITFPHEEHWTVMELEITFDNKSNNFYSFTLISQSYFDYYNCATVDELFENDDFINIYSDAMIMEVNNGKAISDINTAFKSNTSIYFYEGFSERPRDAKIENFKNYIGYFHYN